MSAIHLGGSRSLASPALVAPVVRAILASGQQIHVGCARGADQAVIQSALSVPQGHSSLFVFAAFGPGGAGAWSGSAVCSVFMAACAGASVRWLAGGSLAVPLVARLMRRSRAALHGCSASVFFLASPGSPGSLAVAGHAVAAGQPVFAFCPFIPSAPRGCAGRWVAASFLGFPCWCWSPAQQSMF